MPSQTTNPNWKIEIETQINLINHTQGKKFIFPVKKSSIHNNFLFACAFGNDIYNQRFEKKLNKKINHKYDRRSEK